MGLFQKMNERLSDTFQRANGPDALGRVSMAIGLACGILNLFFYNLVLSMLSFMLIFYAVYRLFSTNASARRAEDESFRKLLARPSNALRRMREHWANRKTTAYLKCKECKQRLSVPKGKGVIRVTCPKCGRQTNVRT